MFGSNYTKDLVILVLDWLFSLKNKNWFHDIFLRTIIFFFISEFIQCSPFIIAFIKKKLKCNICTFIVAGGSSIGCPGNSGAAGTYFNANLLSLRVSNDNLTTETDTPLLDFSTRPLWSNVYVENHAKVLVPLVWSRVQVKKLCTQDTCINTDTNIMGIFSAWVWENSAVIFS